MKSYGINRSPVDSYRFLQDSGRYINKWIYGMNGFQDSEEPFKTISPKNVLHVGGFESGKAGAAISSLIMRAASNSQNDIYFFIDQRRGGANFSSFKSRKNASFFSGERTLSFIDILYSELNERKRASILGKNYDLANIFVTIDEFHSIISLIDVSENSDRFYELLSEGQRYKIFFVCISQIISTIPDKYLSLFYNIHFFKLFKGDEKTAFFQERPELLRKIKENNLKKGYFIDLNLELIKAPFIVYDDRQKILSKSAKILNSIFLSQKIAEKAKIKNGEKSNAHKISTLLRF